MSEIGRRELLQMAAAAVVGHEMEFRANASERSLQKDAKGAPRELYTGSPIEVYTNTLSVLPGDDLTLHVSTIARRFNLQITRIGSEENVVWRQGNLPGSFFPTPDDAWERGCRWPAAVRLQVPANWKSGYYQIKAITADAGVSSQEFRAFVTVRAASPTAKILLVLATNTYHAYNFYGGASSYIKKGTGHSSGLSNTTGEYKTSFQRPWMPMFTDRTAGMTDKMAGLPEGHGFGVDRFSPAGFPYWEEVMVRWLERNGYAVDYAISSDLEFHADLLGRYRLMLSVGHDEYWSWGMRDAVESFVARGGNVCFFSGDIAVCQVRYEDQGQSMVCYKDDYRKDPYFSSDRKQRSTGYWSSHHIGRPETRMTGLSCWYAGMARFRTVSPRGAGGYLVYRSGHWIFKDSGIVYGDCFGQSSAIVHYEVDGCPIRMENGLPYPADGYDGPRNLEILAMTPASLELSKYDELQKKEIPNPEGLKDLAEDIFGDSNPTAIGYVSANRGHAVMSLYTDNGTVFCAGTTDWTSGLAGKDPAVERVTRNLIDRLMV